MMTRSESMAKLAKKANKTPPKMKGSKRND